MSLMADLWPGAGLSIPLHLSWGAAAVCGIVSLAISYLSTRSFRRANTTVDPRHPERTSTLVTHGIYRFSRNPMYLALLLLLLGWALILANVMALLGLPLCFFYLDLCQIRREEQHLLQRFAAEYRTYQSRVRRWL